MPLPDPHLPTSAPGVERNFLEVDEQLRLTASVGYATVASAASITVPDRASLVEITGTTNIDTIAVAQRGRTIVLYFSDAAPGTVEDATGNLALAGDFAAAQFNTLTLVCDGVSWIETSRAVT